MGTVPTMLCGDVPCIVEQYMRGIVRDNLLCLAIKRFALLLIQFSRRAFQQHVEVRVGVETKIGARRGPFVASIERIQLVVGIGVVRGPRSKDAIDTLLRLLLRRAEDRLRENPVFHLVDFEIHVDLAHIPCNASTN